LLDRDACLAQDKKRLAGRLRVAKFTTPAGLAVSPPEDVDYSQLTQRSRPRPVPDARRGRWITPTTKLAIYRSNRRRKVGWLGRHKACRDKPVSPLRSACLSAWSRNGAGPRDGSPSLLLCHRNHRPLRYLLIPTIGIWKPSNGPPRPNMIPPESSRNANGRRSTMITSQLPVTDGTNNRDPTYADAILDRLRSFTCPTDSNSPAKPPSTSKRTQKLDQPPSRLHTSIGQRGSHPWCIIPLRRATSFRNIQVPGDNHPSYPATSRNVRNRVFRS